MNVGLYFATVLIWGTAWIAIHLQLGSVEAFASIFYRFAIAGALFLPLMIILNGCSRLVGEIIFSFYCRVPVYLA